MRVTAKFVVLTLAIVTIAMLTMMWRNQRFLRDDHRSEVRTALETQAALMATVVHEKTEFLVNQMTQFVSVRSASRALNTTAQQILGSFEAIALLTVSDDRSWSAQWVEKNTHSTLSRLPEGHLAGLFASLPIATMEQGAPSWVLVQDAQKHPVLALLNFVQLTSNDNATPRTALMVGLVNPAYLSDAVKEYSGTALTAAVMDVQGSIFAHSDNQWVGQEMSDNRLIGSVLDERGASFFKEVQDGQREQYVASNPVAGSNVVVLLAQPQESTQSGLANLELAILGFGILILAAFAAHYVGRKIERQIELPLIMQPAPLADLGPSHLTVAPKTTVEDPGAFARFSASLSQELKGPVVALLGYAQIVLAQTEEDETRLKTKNIEKEARKIKKIADHLTRFAGLDGGGTQLVNVAELIERVLKKLAPEMSQITVEKCFSPAPQLQSHGRQIEIICEELLRNAIQAMQYTAERHLIIAVEPNGPSVRLRLKDSGVGIGADLRAKMFDAFVTRDPDHHLGLGLGVVRGILMDQGGHISVNSEPGEGAEVIVDFLPDSALPKASKLPERLIVDEPVDITLEPLLNRPIKKGLPARLPIDEMLSLTDEKFLFAGEQSKPSVTLPELSDGEDFKVKIRRPKLKVDH
jgi:signal transduction histidine kinase